MREKVTKNTIDTTESERLGTSHIEIGENYPKFLVMSFDFFLNILFCDNYQLDMENKFF